MHWRTHPKLQGKLHPEHPDDIRVIVHDGGPRVTKLRPEVVWVKVNAAQGDVFTGKVLNAPSNCKVSGRGRLSASLFPTLPRIR